MRAPPVKCHVKLSKARVRLTTPKIDGPRRTEPIQVSAFVVQRLPVMQLEQPGMLYSDVNAPPKKGKKKKELLLYEYRTGETSHPFPLQASSSS